MHEQHVQMHTLHKRPLRSSVSSCLASGWHRADRVLNCIQCGLPALAAGFKFQPLKPWPTWCIVIPKSDRRNRRTLRPPTATWKAIETLSGSNHSRLDFIPTKKIKVAPWKCNESLEQRWRLSCTIFFWTSRRLPCNHCRTCLCSKGLFRGLLLSWAALTDLTNAYRMLHLAPLLAGPSWFSVQSSHHRDFALGLQFRRIMAEASAVLKKVLGGSTEFTASLLQD